MRKIVPMFVVAGLLGSGLPVYAAEKAAGSAPAQDDAAASAGAVEVRANAAFAAGEWANALPLLKKVAALVKDQPERLGNVEEQIRVCERKLAKQAAANLKNRNNPGAVTTTPGSSPLAPERPPTAEERKPHAKPTDGQVVELTIQDLGNFEYDQEKGGNIPDDVKSLGGHTVRLRGYMIPMDQAENITQFALVPSLFACCFGQPPQVQHTVVAHCPEGKAVSYFADEITVEGKLKVDEKKDDGFIVSIFEMDIASVKPAPK